MPDFDALRDVEREHVASSRALNLLLRDWHTLDAEFRQDLSLAQATAARTRLEATYVLRILAAFEEALRARLLQVGTDVGEASGFRTKCERAGARFGVDSRLRLLTEGMVEDRNRLAHGRNLIPRESIRIVAGRCRRFLAACG